MYSQPLRTHLCHVSVAIDTFLILPGKDDSVARFDPIVRRIHPCEVSSPRETVE